MAVCKYGENYRRQGQYDQAEKLRKALAMDQKTVGPWNNWGSVTWINEKPPKLRTASAKPLLTRDGPGPTLI